MGTLDYLNRKPWVIVGVGGATTVYLETPLQSVVIESDPTLKVVVISVD